MYALALAAVAGGLALAGVLYEAGVRPLWLEHFSLEWRLGSDELASVAYRRLAEGNSRESLRLFELALRRDPASPYRWCDYGEALLAAGDKERAARVMARGIELGPAVAPILMRAVNFARRVGDGGSALRHGRQLLALAPDYDDAIFTAWDRMELPTAAALASGLPDRRSAQSYLRHAVDGPDLGQAFQTWLWIESKGYVDDALADEYTSALLGRHEYTAAWQAWTSYAGARERGYPGENAIFNAGFERAPAGAVFDWRIEASPGVAVTRDFAIAAEGKASLRLSFDHSGNLSDGGISQRMVLPPGVWRFEGRMRTQEITTDQGLGFRLLDPENTRLLDARTASLTGTHDWTLLSVGFEVHPATRVVEVRVFRTPSLKFDNKLGGTAWIDGLVLRRERAADRRPPAMSFNLPIERQRQSVKQAANSVDPLGLTPIACPPGTTNKMCVDPVKETVLHGFSPGLGWDPFSAFSTAFEPTDVASGPPVNDDPTTVDVYGNIGMLDIIGLTSGGATGGNSVFQKACSLVPQGRVLGIQGAVGGVSGQTGTLEQVLNYTTGETTLFASGGIQAGVWNGGAQGNAIGGLIYGNLKGDNSKLPGAIYDTFRKPERSRWVHRSFRGRPRESRAGRRHGGSRRQLRRKPRGTLVRNDFGDILHPAAVRGKLHRF
jgi:hypothetical protein